MRLDHGRKVYRVDGGIPNVVVTAICSECAVISLAAIMGIVFLKFDFCLSFPLCVFVFIPVTVLLVLCVVHEVRMYHRIQDISTGESKYGTVEKFVYVVGKAPYYALTLSYRNSNNEECCLKSSVSLSLGKRVLSKKKLPIFVKGEYACLDVNSIRNMPMTSNYDRSITKECIFCGSTLPGKKHYCSCCKNSI